MYTKYKYIFQEFHIKKGKEKFSIKRYFTSLDIFIKHIRASFKEIKSGISAMNELSMIRSSN